ncbi:MAG: isopentenyl phosphate kinase [Thermoplasmataceae archaeon]
MTVIVKLGGSLITDKGRYRTFRRAETEAVISNLLSFREEIVLVHGGGSFGHIKAKEYGIPGQINEKSKKGFSVIHHDMLSLNQEVSGLFIDRGFLPVSVPPANFLFKRSKALSSFRNYMDRGFMPVTFGDVYVKNEREFGIYSGDTLVLDLARIFLPDRVIFISDVDGIYDKNPKIFPEAKLLDNPEDGASFQFSVPDVTGGIQNKFAVMKKVRKYSKSVYLINGLKPERLLDLDSQRFIGTVIR